MSAPTPQVPGQPTAKPPLRVFSMVLFSVCAILLLSQMTLTARIGPSAIFWTIALIVVFFIPYGLVTAELGSTYPDTGGIYAWVVRAFGNRWGTRVSWWYWVNVALWVPSVYLIFSGTLSSMFFNGNLSIWVQVAIAVVLIWVNYWVNSRTLETGAWVSNLGAIITVAFIAILAIAGIVHAATSGSATEWSLAAMMPQNGLGSLGLAIPVVMYNFLGFELMSSASADMANPKRDVPRAIIIAGSMIGGFYLLGTIGMQLLLDYGDISETTGLMDALKVGFGNSTLGQIAVVLLGLGALYCFFATLIPWTIGANIAAAESSQQGDLPRIFGRTHPTRKTPIGAALLTSVVGTIVTLVYALVMQLTGGSDQVDALFWNLFVFSSIVFLLPYLVMMPAFRTLRRIDAATERPYRVPGGPVIEWLVTWVPFALLVVAIALFIWSPWNESGAFVAPDWGHVAQIAGGLVVVVVIQEVFVAKAPAWAAARRRDAAATGTPSPASTDPTTPSPTSTDPAATDAALTPTER